MNHVPAGSLTLTKLGHSCVRLERDGARLVIDPGVFSAPTALEGSRAVLVTHAHPDHIDQARLRSALDADSGLQVWGPADVVEILGGPRAQVHAVADGDEIEVAGLRVRVLGEWHATIHPDIPRMRNCGFLVEDVVLHPGDALTLPGVAVPVLMLPVCAPWLKLSEVIDYVRAVAPDLALPVHDTTYSAAALATVARQLGPGGVGIGETEYRHWSDGDHVVAPTPV